MSQRPPGSPRSDQRWAASLRNHAKAILARDFFVATTVTFRLRYVFVVIHHDSHRLLHLHLAGVLGGLHHVDSLAAEPT